MTIAQDEEVESDENRPFSCRSYGELLDTVVRFDCLSGPTLERLEKNIGDAARGWLHGSFVAQKRRDEDAAGWGHHLDYTNVLSDADLVTDTVSLPLNSGSPLGQRQSDRENPGSIRNIGSKPEAGARVHVKEKDKSFHPPLMVDVIDAKDSEEIQILDTNEILVKQSKNGVSDNNYILPGTSFAVSQRLPPAPAASAPQRASTCASAARSKDYLLDGSGWSTSFDGMDIVRGSKVSNKQSQPPDATALSGRIQFIYSPCLLVSDQEDERAALPNTNAETDEYGWDDDAENALLEQMGQYRAKLRQKDSASSMNADDPDISLDLLHPAASLKGPSIRLYQSEASVPVFPPISHQLNLVYLLV